MRRSLPLGLILAIILLTMIPSVAAAPLQQAATDSCPTLAVLNNLVDRADHITNLSATVLDSSSVQLNWTPPNDDVGAGSYYQVYWGIHRGGEYANIARIDDINAASFVILNLDPSVTYYIVVVSHDPTDEIDHSRTSNEIAIRTSDGGTVSVPDLESYLPVGSAEQATVCLGLVDGTTGDFLVTLTDGMTVDLANYASESLVVRAYALATSISSISLQQTGLNPLFVNDEPYIFGAPIFTFGIADPITLTATPYSDDNGVGVAGITTTVTFNVVDTTPQVGTPQIAVNAGLNIEKGSTTTLTPNNLDTIADNVPASEVGYSIIMPPSEGTLLLNGQTASSFSQADINAGLLTYVHNGGENISDQFIFGVTAGVGAITDQVFQITIIPPIVVIEDGGNDNINPNLPPEAVGLNFVVNTFQIALQETVTLEIQGQNLSDLYGISIFCNVDPTVLAGGSFELGEAFDAENSFNLDQGFQAGSWNVVALQRNPAPPISGNGVLMRLTFTAVGAGNSLIVCESEASNRQGNGLNYELGSYPSITVTSGTEVADGGNDTGSDTTSGGNDTGSDTTSGGNDTGSDTTSGGNDTGSDTTSGGSGTTDGNDTGTGTIAPDTDGDGVPDDMDNCPAIANPEQLDNDADLLGNECDETPDLEPEATEEAPEAITRITGFVNSINVTSVVLNLSGVDTDLTQNPLEDGSFEFAELPVGEYTLTATLANHLPASITFSVTFDGEEVILPPLFLSNGDVNGDQSIDVNDVPLIFALYLQTENLGNADLNLDGIVDVRDLAIFFGNFGLSNVQPWA